MPYLVLSCKYLIVLKQNYKLITSHIEMDHLIHHRSLAAYRIKSDIYLVPSSLCLLVAQDTLVRFTECIQLSLPKCQNRIIISETIQKRILKKVVIWYAGKMICKDRLKLKWNGTSGRINMSSNSGRWLLDSINMYTWENSQKQYKHLCFHF